MSGNILVTGGAGFIGSRIADYLADRSELQTVVYDVRRSARRIGNVLRVRGDVFDSERLLEVMRDGDVSQVIHMVGLASIPDCRQDPDRSFRLNVLSVHRILEAMRVTDAEHLIFPSTAAVYGAVEAEQVDEGMDPKPTSVYGCHKLAAEALIRGYAKDYGVKSTILRVFNVYGDFLNEQGVLSAFVRRALKSEPLIVHGGDQLRDFVHLRDVVDAFVQSLGNGQVYQRVINVGSGVGVSIREVAEMVCVRFPEAEVVYQPVNNGEYSIYAEVSEMRRLLGCEATDPRVGISAFIEKCKRDHAEQEN